MIRRMVPWLGLVCMAAAFFLWQQQRDREWRRWQEPIFSTVILDPGHGGRDAGAVDHGLKEKELNLEVAKQVRDILEEAGVRVFLTREEDVYLSLAERIQRANQLRGALFVSVHFNQAERTEAAGVETFYPIPGSGPPLESFWQRLIRRPRPNLSRFSEELAAEVQLAVIDHTSAENRGIKQGNFFVLRNARVPAVLVEGGFISNPMEAALLAEPAYQRRVADGIGQGILRFLRQPRAYFFEESQTEYRPRG